MAGRAGEHEEMPDKVTVAKTPVTEKNQAGGVGDATGKEPENRFQRYGHDERPNYDEDNPAHAEIKNQGELLRADADSKLNDHADNGEHPDQHEHGPTQSAPERP